MIRKYLFFAAILSGFFSIVSCGFKPESESQNYYQQNKVYSITGNFNEPIAVIVIDRNGVFEISWSAGSSFLIDANKGLFGTAKHVVSHDVSYKIFFCGRVYRAERVLPQVITDIAFIRITDDFDPSQFPRPYPIGEIGNPGQRVFVRGIHPHPLPLPDNTIIHQIAMGYYGLPNTGLPGQSYEFVYDNLPGSLVSVNRYNQNKSINGIDRNLADVVLRYSQINVDMDHRIIVRNNLVGFQGLSGGPTLNDRGEIIGINSVQPGGQGEHILEREGLRYVPLTNLELMSSDDLRRALESIR